MTGTHSHCPVFRLQRREFEDGKNQNRLRETGIQKVVSTFKTFKTIHKYAYRATFKEIQENEFNLNFPRYVDTFEEEEEIDIRAVQEEIEEFEKRLAGTQKEMDAYLVELGFVRTQ